MAYIDQSEKKSISAKIMPILKAYGLSGTLSIRHHSQLVLTIRKGPIDFIGNVNEVCGDKNFWDKRFEPITCGYLDVNEYHYKDHYSGVALEVLSKLIPEMKGENWYDHSDIQSDYFSVKHYFSVKIGTWEKPYVLV